MAEATPFNPYMTKSPFDTDMAKVEVPAAFREAAEKSVAQTKDAWDKMKVATEEATGVLESSYTSAAKGSADYGLKLIDIARFNANAAFDFYSQLLGVKTVSEAVELTTAHARKSFETATLQSKDLTALAQKIATETAQPIKAGMETAFKKVA